MCTTCVTATDTLFVNGAGLAAAVAVSWERVRDRLAGRSRVERELRTWEANAALMRSMGLDPMQVLGAPPAVPATDAAGLDGADLDGADLDGADLEPAGA